MDPVLLSVVVAVVVATVGLGGLTVALWALRRTISLVKRLVVIALVACGIGVALGAVAAAAVAFR